MPRRTDKRVLVTLHFLSLSVAELITWALAVIGKLAIDPDVPNPDVPIATLTQQSLDLRSTATTRVADKSAYLTNLSNLQVNAVLNSFSYIANQVENIANQKAGSDEALAREIINRLGFRAKEEAIKEGSYFKVAATGPAWAHLLTKAAARNNRALYFWRYTTTPNDAQSWSQPYVTSGASIVLTDLQRDTRYYFQSCALVIPGRNPKINVNYNIFSWSDAVSGVVV